LFEWDKQSRESCTIVVAEAKQRTEQQKQRDIYETHRHRIFSVSYYMTASEVLAEDILTETFVQAFSTAREPDAAGIDRALLHKLEEHLSLMPEALAKPDADADLRYGQVRRTDLEEAVVMLPARERLIFLLRDVEGYPANQIAALLRCDEPEVLRTLISARIRMRNALSALRMREAIAC